MKIGHILYMFFSFDYGFVLSTHNVKARPRASPPKFHTCYTNSSMCLFDVCHSHLSSGVVKYYDFEEAWTYLHCKNIAHYEK